MSDPTRPDQDPVTRLPPNSGGYAPGEGRVDVYTWEWGPDHAGTTDVTVTYLGFSAGGSITATDSRPPG